MSEEKTGSLFFKSIEDGQEVSVRVDSMMTEMSCGHPVQVITVQSLGTHNAVQVCVDQEVDPEIDFDEVAFLFEHMGDLMTAVRENTLMDVEKFANQTTGEKK